MTTRGRNIGASIRARLLELARSRGEAFDYVLNRYAVERLLIRVAASPHRSDLVLKGATLLRVWSMDGHRPTRDVDFLGFGSSALDDVRRMIRDLCDVEVPDDGITFDARTIVTERIKPDEEYQGVRARLDAVLAAAKVPVQIDIGFGDAVSPVEDDYPVLLDGSSTPRLRIYPREAVIAEKVQAMVHLGMVNSRMKDFFDVEQLARHFDFEGAAMVDALRATFRRRQTAMPASAPLALTEAFANDSGKLTQWNAFVRRTGLIAAPLADVITAIGRFVVPILAASDDGASLGRWPAGGPWTRDGS